MYVSELKQRNKQLKQRLKEACDVIEVLERRIAMIDIEDRYGICEETLKKELKRGLISNVYSLSDVHNIDFWDKCANDIKRGR